MGIDNKPVFFGPFVLFIFVIHGNNFDNDFMYFGSRDSSVGIATGYGLDDRRIGVRVPVGSRIFSTSSIPILGPTQPPIQWVPGVKRPWREADHSV
jgi:hypothetical protein